MNSDKRQLFLYAGLGLGTGIGLAAIVQSTAVTAVAAVVALGGFLIFRKQARLFLDLVEGQQGRMGLAGAGRRQDPAQEQDFKRSGGLD